MVERVLLNIESQVDTLAVVNANQVVAFYSDMMDKQATQFTILISVLCGIVVFIIGATWWWNYRGAKNQISEEIEANKRSFQRLFKTTTIQMDNQMDAMMKEKVESLTKSLHEEFEEYKRSTTESINNQKAELCRVFALHCDSTNSFFPASTWWYTAARLYHETGSDSMVQLALDAAIASLKKVAESPHLEEEDADRLDTILSDIEALPDVLIYQKNDTKKIVKQLKASLMNRGSKGV